jgi:hypothetical protein
VALVMIAAPEVFCSAVIGMTTLLAFGADPPEIWGCAVSVPVWLPFAVLAAFAAGSALFGMSNPESFAAMFGVV